MTAEIPVLDTLTAAGAEHNFLTPREFMLARMAALIAVDAPPASCLAHAGGAADSGVTANDIQAVMIAVAPVVGTPRVVAAGGNILKALGFAIAVADSETAGDSDAGHRRDRQLPVFVVNAHYVFGGLRAWGSITPIIWVLQLLAAAGVVAGSQLARWFGGAVPGLSVIDQVFVIPACPFLSLLVIAVDVVALDGLCAYGSRANLTTQRHGATGYARYPGQRLAVPGVRRRLGLVGWAR